MAVILHVYICPQRSPVCRDCMSWGRRSHRAFASRSKTYAGVTAVSNTLWTSKLKRGKGGRCTFGRTNIKLAWFNPSRVHLTADHKYTGRHGWRNTALLLSCNTRSPLFSAPYFHLGIWTELNTNWVRSRMWMILPTVYAGTTHQNQLGNEWHHEYREKDVITYTVIYSWEGMATAL